MLWLLEWAWVWIQVSFCKLFSGVLRKNPVATWENRRQRASQLSLTGGKLDKQLLRIRNLNQAQGFARLLGVHSSPVMKSRTPFVEVSKTSLKSLHRHVACPNIFPRAPSTSSEGMTGPSKPTPVPPSKRRYDWSPIGILLSTCFSDFHDPVPPHLLGTAVSQKIP